MTVCDNCGNSFFEDEDRRSGKIHYCSETCRRKIYADKAVKERVERALKENSIHRLGVTVRKITRLGYEVKIKQKLSE